MYIIVECAFYGQPVSPIESYLYVGFCAPLEEFIKLSRLSHTTKQKWEPFSFLFGSLFFFFFASYSSSFSSSCIFFVKYICSTQTTVVHFSFFFSPLSYLFLLLFYFILIFYFLYILFIYFNSSFIFIYLFGMSRCVQRQTTELKVELFLYSINLINNISPERSRFYQNTIILC